MILHQDIRCDAMQCDAMQCNTNKSKDNPILPCRDSLALSILHPIEINIGISYISPSYNQPVRAADEHYVVFRARPRAERSRAAPDIHIT